ncbi:hypothetical protein U472_13665 [Orenia metallireducens]|jgi:hypothetical protein|uniref:Uncharacterized protein n=1 Tax=Orenia metallireducens TaxID=1413210 RepID=A0A1C0A5J6_9FIRM|nr:hypothetical protein [Orenia metallireducens]OCL25393.1 hypothetical protein U472_13665 [Orenia metallireducens]
MQLSLKNTITTETAQILCQFKDVKIYDSTKISLPDKLAESWPGLDGRNAKSSLKIQIAYILLSKSITNLKLTKFPGTDTFYTEQIIT